MNGPEGAGSVVGIAVFWREKFGRYFGAAGVDIYREKRYTVGSTRERGKKVETVFGRNGY